MFENRETPRETLRLVSWYLTPYAVLLVLIGLAFGHPPAADRWLTLGILAVGIVVNISALIGLDKAPEKASIIRDIRIGFNVFCNFWLIFILLPYWPEIWMLLLVIVIALAVYDTWELTVVYGCAFSGVLILIGYLKGMMHGPQVGKFLVESATMIFIGLFTNHLLGAGKSEKNRGDKKIRRASAN